MALYYHLCHNLTTYAISIDMTVFMCYTCTRNTKEGHENDNSSGIFDAVFMISPAIRTIIGYNSYHFPAQRLFYDIFASFAQKHTSFANSELKKENML